MAKPATGRNLRPITLSLATWGYVVVILVALSLLMGLGALPLRW